MYHQEVPGGKLKILISPRGDTEFYDLREDEDGRPNLEHGRILFFDSGEDAFDYLVSSND